MNKIDIQIETNEDFAKPCVIIKACANDSSVEKIISAIQSIENFDAPKIIVKDDENEIVLNLEQTLFFESVDSKIYIHTADKIFTTRQSLSALENSLPSYFVRVSRSGIVNLSKIYEIRRNLHGSSLIRFSQSNKQTMISRRFYKSVKSQLMAQVISQTKENK